MTGVAVDRTGSGCAIGPAVFRLTPDCTMGGRTGVIIGAVKAADALVRPTAPAGCGVA